MEKKVSPTTQLRLRDGKQIYMEEYSPILRDQGGKFNWSFMIDEMLEDMWKSESVERKWEYEKKAFVERAQYYGMDRELKQIFRTPTMDVDTPDTRAMDLAKKTNMKHTFTELNPDKGETLFKQVVKDPQPTFVDKFKIQKFPSTSLTQDNTIKNPILGTGIETYVKRLGGNPIMNITPRVLSDGTVFPLAVQGFLDSWPGGRSPTFTIQAKSTGLKKSVVFTTTTTQNYPKFSGLGLIGVGSFWLYVSLKDKDPMFGFYMLPSEIKDSSSVPLGPYPIISILKKLGMKKEVDEE